MFYVEKAKTDRESFVNHSVPLTLSRHVGTIEGPKQGSCVPRVLLYAYCGFK